MRLCGARSYNSSNFWRQATRNGANPPDTSTCCSLSRTVDAWNLHKQAWILENMGICRPQSALTPCNFIYRSSYLPLSAGATTGTALNLTYDKHPSRCSNRPPAAQNPLFFFLQSQDRNMYKRQTGAIHLCRSLIRLPRGLSQASVNYSNHQPPRASTVCHRSALANRMTPFSFCLFCLMGCEYHPLLPRAMSWLIHCFSLGRGCHQAGCCTVASRDFSLLLPGKESSLLLESL